jgi:hypothetical protein
MSSKKHHIITRDNYEEYFLLYIDDELPADVRKEVESFVLLHPDLQEELDLLQGTRLESESVVFEGKESLLSNRLELDIPDESLLLFIDNELEPAESRRVQLEIEHNKSYYNGYQQLKAAKLDAADEIICPFKNDLYRSADSRKSLPWLRIAAAAILLLGGGSLLVISTKKDAQPPVARVEIKKPVEKITPKVEESNPEKVETLPAEQFTAHNINTKKQIQKTVEPDVEPVRSNHLPVPQPRNLTPDQDVATLSQPDIDLAANDIKRQTKRIDPEQQNTNQNTVTNPIVTSYNPIATTNAEPSVNFENSNGKSVRGLLRKATRFIERRTGINPVNDDDKLLVGVVAINLK